MIHNYNRAILLIMRSEMAAQGTSSFITVKIGSDVKAYTVHKDILVHHSEYFEKALRNDWQEAQDRIVVLSDVDPVTFDLFLNWTQQHMLRLDVARASLEDVDDEYEDASPSMDLDNDGGNATRTVSFAHGSWDDFSPFDIDLLLMLQATGFADRFLMADFKEALQYHFVDHVVDCPPASLRFIIYAYANHLVPKDSPIEDVLVDAHYKCWRLDDSEGDIDLVDQLPHAFVRRLIIRGGEMNQGDGLPGELLMECEYHGHKTPADMQNCAKRKAQLLVPQHR